MRYIQPYGIADPDASYINGDPSIARQGSIPPAEAFEHPMRELVNVILDSQIAPDEADLEQVAKGIRSQRMNYADDTGSVNTLSVAFDPPISAYTIGFPMRVKAANTNTGPCTIDAGGGRVGVKKPNGSELSANDWPAGGLADLVFDGTNFQMINFTGAAVAGPPTVFQINIPYTVDTGTPNTIIANFSPAITSYTAGLIFMVKISNTNTTFANINVNGLGLKAVWAQGNTAAYPLLPCDLVAGDVLIFVYDGTRFWVYANTIINTAVSFNVSNNTQIDNLIFALGRKRILSTAWVTINLATGIYSQITTYHANADRIELVGTLIGTLPTLADFAHTGNSSTARANDSANNIAMLRSRYGTEVKAPNTIIGGAIQHYGGGHINLRNILVTGDNVYAGVQESHVRGITVDGSSSGIIVRHCAVWGLGGYGISAGSGASIGAENTVVCSSYRGWYAYIGGTIDLMECGSFGNTTDGVLADRASTVCCHSTEVGETGWGPFAATQIMSNGQNGCRATTLGQVGLDKSTITGNALDLYATGMGNIGRAGGSTPSSIGTMSPARGVVGNGNSIINSDV